MIKTFKSKNLKKFYIDGILKGVQHRHTTKLAMILDLLEAACEINDMNFPGSRLHKLEPKNANRWAVSVSGNWRIVFAFKDSDAYDVDYLDYH